MLRLERIDSKNVWEIIRLEVNETQKNYVATNTESIIEAYTAITANGIAYPFGIYDDELPVGFLMIGYGVDDDWEDAPRIAENAYSIWRLMIDKKYQDKGYGKKAVELALNYIKTYPCGKAEYCYLSYEPSNNVARKLYESFGFKETGDKDGDELLAVLKL